jgi:predicted hydrocarbon binding protein
MLSGRLYRLFIESVTQEVGLDNLPAIMAGNRLLPAAFKPGILAQLDGLQAERANASLQQGLRLYYGRGARGMLMRIGQDMWNRMVARANFFEKAELEIARRLPVPARRRHILETLAGRLHEAGGDTSVHSLDFDLLLVDRCGAVTLEETASEPICFVTLGLVQGALLWATGHEADVEEIACKATGAPACEFKIKLGGK